MGLRWTTEASGELIGIIQHIRTESATPARMVAQTILDDIDRLETFALHWPPRRG